jgi:hypothetical protein
MKFLKGLLEHDAVPFGVITSGAGPQETCIEVYPETPLYGIGLRGHNDEGEVVIERITSGGVNHNLIAGPVDASVFAGNDIFPMDFGPVSEDLPIVIVFSRAERFQDSGTTSHEGCITARIDRSALSLPLAELDAYLKRMRSPSLRLSVIGSRMSLVGLESFGDMRWCREEILRLRTHNQRLWDREYTQAQVAAWRAKHGETDLSGPSETVLGHPPTYPGNTSSAPTTGGDDDENDY